MRKEGAGGFTALYYAISNLFSAYVTLNSVGLPFNCKETFKTFLYDRRDATFKRIKPSAAGSSETTSTEITLPLMQAESTETNKVNLHTDMPSTSSDENFTELTPLSSILHDVNQFEYGDV